MTGTAYRIVSALTEDRFDETDNLTQAIQIARRIVEGGCAEGPVSIEHDGLVIHQFVATADGVIDELERLSI